MIIEPYLKPSVQATDTQMVKILLVDDLAENLVSLESLLSKEDENIEYLFAQSGEEALKIALQEELALILLDVQMPGMNGYEVARYLRDISKTREVPIIFVTAINEQEAHVIEGFEVGAVDFLFKPLHPYITKAKVSTFVRFYLQKKELEKLNNQTQQINQDLEKRVEERTKELTRVNKDLDNFVYTASHDLKAPINNIEGLMTALHETVEEGHFNLEEVKKLMSMIDDSVARFKNTLLDLTEVAKLQHESTDIKDKVNLGELLEDIKLNVKDLVDNYDANITTDFSEAPEIYFSRKNLRSILYNLVSNSIKYSCPGRRPEIEISTKQNQDYVLLSVRDNGLGLRKEDQNKIFGMFKRLHAHVEGTGIGLAIVKRIVENSDGMIEIESEVDKGSVFNIFLKQPMRS